MKDWTVEELELCKKIKEAGYIWIPIAGDWFWNAERKEKMLVTDGGIASSLLKLWGGDRGFGLLTTDDCLDELRERGFGIVKILKHDKGTCSDGTTYDDIIENVSIVDFRAVCLQTLLEVLEEREDG